MADYQELEAKATAARESALGARRARGEGDGRLGELLANFTPGTWSECEYLFEVTLALYTVAEAAYADGSSRTGDVYTATADEYLVYALGCAAAS